MSTKAQKDSSPQKPKKDNIFTKKKGLLGRLAQSVITDTTTPSNTELQRIDVLYKKYTGRVIRNVEIRRVDFGVPINDTTRSFKNKLTHMADRLHRTTREGVIRNNLFFKKNDTLLPILLADNERHLRDQPFINDAKILVKSVLGTRDSVDIIVLTKDVLSIGGRFRMSSLTKVETALREDNLGGLGDKIQLGFFYDQKRNKRTGYSAEYTARNIAGSYVNGTFGILDYGPTFNSLHRQETTVYTQFLKPLVNPYMKWTYALEGAWHKNANQYFPDSTYRSELKYQYYNVDAWVGLNMSARQLGDQAKDDRLRTLVGLRVLHQEFQDVPARYEDTYFYRYANLTGILASISIFRQDFYKTQYVYGFGRNEDVPEGLDFAVTTGWTNKEQRVRPYMGLDMQFNYFTRKKNYFNYILRVGGYNYNRIYEDISILGNVEFFGRLRQMTKGWKQRTFLSAGLTSQWNVQLNEPLLLESQFGLPEYENINLGGDHRLTLKAESVFFSPWSLLSFKFAPFVFANGAFLTPQGDPFWKTKFYHTIGGGIRTRNESLVFGTLELRGFFFPTRNFNGDRFRVEFNTSIKFRYISQFIRRPQFITVN